MSARYTDSGLASKPVLGAREAWTTGMSLRR
jgi:hypothetical protein